MCHSDVPTQEWTRRWCLSSAPSFGACSPQPTRTRRRTELRTSPLSLAGETRWGREDKSCSLTQVGKQRKTGGCLQKRLHPHHPSPLRLPHSISLSVSSCLHLLSIFHSQKSAFSISLLRPKPIRFGYGSKISSEGQKFAQIYVSHLEMKIQINQRQARCPTKCSTSLSE